MVKMETACVGAVGMKKHGKDPKQTNKQTKLN